VVYIARYLTHHIMSVTLNVGTRLPAYATSMGRILLAQKNDHEIDGILAASSLTQFTSNTLTDPAKIKIELEKARKQGYCIVNQELEMGLRSVAVPILNQRGLVVAAINVGTQAARIEEPELRDRVLPSLQRAAADIQRIIPA